MQNKVYLISSIVGFSLLMYWIFYNPYSDIPKSVEGLDNRPDSISADRERVKIGKDFKQFENVETELTGKWTRFRGKDFDNIVKDNIPLIDKFGKEVPKILWTVETGEGHAGAVIYKGKVYFLDYIEEEKADALRCFSLETGKELWQRKYNVHVKRNHGMSRTVPAITDSFIVTIGPKGHVMCANPETGDFRWGIDLVKEYKSEIPFWYTGQCSLIDNDTAIIAPGGSSLIIGVDCKTGKVVWNTPNPKQWKMSHSSIMPMEFEGKKMYIYAPVGGICGISAEGADKGKILWQTEEFAPNVVAPSPVVLPNGKIFMTAGYGAGSILFEIKKKADGYEVKTLQMFKPKNGAASEQQTAVVYNNKMYIILPKDAGSDRNQMVCCKIDDMQNFVWKSGKKYRFGLGPYIIADGKFYIVDDDGSLTIARVSANRFEFLDKAQIIEGQDAWGPIAIADGKLIMRDSKNIICLDIKKN